MVHRASLLLAAGAVALSALPALADSEADFFRDKTVSIVVPAGPGGSYHLYAQMVQRHLLRHIPGNPTGVVKNMPGAGGASSATYMTNVAPKDGTVIAEMAPGTLTDPLVKQLKFDARKFSYLGSIAARDFSVAVWHTVPVKTIADLKKTEVTIGTTGRSSAGYIVPHFINSVLGTKMKVITGYASGGDTNIAIERGEVQGRGNFYSGFASVRPDWISEKKIRFIATLGPKNPALDGVPRVRDQLTPGSIEAKTFDLMEVNFNVGQAFYAPPGIPRARLATLRRAFDAMLADPALKKELDSRNLDFTPQSAADVDKAIAHGFKDVNDEVIKRFRQIMGGDQKGKS